MAATAIHFTLALRITHSAAQRSTALQRTELHSTPPSAALHNIAPQRTGLRCTALRGKVNQREAHAQHRRD